ncbi:polysaccharide deacetylase family protein [Leptobacterium sp. I13]|uniref:polysaccharide deacetylase family protein n=1 Tax=Leptobacterium meishanense TaxID=3128904 RepID=UPI0030EF4391
MKHIFINMSKVEVAFTVKVEEFIAHTGPKLTYSKQPLQNEFFIRSHELLFEQGIRNVEINVQDWEGTPCIFPVGERSTIPFDIFAASFYLISRYEEYLPHVKDEHGRYPATESIAFKNNFLELPVIDIWALKLKQVLLRRFPEMYSPVRRYRHISLIDVPVAYCFRKRGFIRTLGGTLVDLFSFRIKRILKRYATLMGFFRDPYDNFEELIELHKHYDVDAMYFFLMADYSNYDKNISVTNKEFCSLVKSVADYSIVSLMASYQSAIDIKMLKRERSRLINLINRPVKKVRLRYNKINIPETYEAFLEAEFNEDYTMGYSHHAGFRAGTCTPFYLYNINFEAQLPIKVNPFSIQDHALLRKPTMEEVKKTLFNIRDEVKKVKGTFITVFSNEILGDETTHKWKELYRELIKK